MASEQTLSELNDLDGDWETWIKKVVETRDIVGVMKAFEELLSILPEDVNIWREYLEYLKNFQKIEILDVYSRCCSMFMEEVYFWQDYLFQLERFGQEWSKLYEVFEEALGYTEDADSAAALFRTIIYAKLRYVKLESIGQDVVNFTPVGQLFSQAYTLLNSQYGQFWDTTLSFTRNYAFFAFYRLKDIELGRKLWKEILGSGVAKEAKWWIDAADAERRFGTIDAARSLLYRGINSVFEDYKPLFDYFIQFERDEGNFEQVQKALKKVNDQMTRIVAKEKQKPKHQKEKKLKSKDQNTVPDNSISNQSRKRPAQNSVPMEDEIEPKILKDKDGFVIPPIPVRLSPRPGSSSPIDNQTSPKAVIMNNTEIENSKDNLSTDSGNPDKTVFVSNLNFNVTEDEIRAFFPGCSNVRLIPRPGTKVSKGFGYVDFPTVEAGQAALKLDRTPLNGRPVFVSAYKPHQKGERAEFKYSTSIERQKLFVKNLPSTCTSEELKEVFSAFGKVDAARIVTKKNGVSKCCGYVDFESEAGATKTLSAQIEIGGRPISAFISNPPSKADTAASSQRPKNSRPALGSRTQQLAAPSSAGRKMRIEGFVPRAVAMTKIKPVKSNGQS